MLGLSYWVVPIFSSTVWTAMLITMLVYWASTGKPHYSTMDVGQTIPYISDIGHDTLKPMFIAMSAITVVTFDLAFIFERWLRHTGKLARNTSVWQKVNSGFATVTAIIGAAGLILLTIFDNLRHNTLHNIFLCVFIGGYIISAIFICWEYQRLGIRYREYSILAYSFWIKLTFIIVEVCLVIAFGVCSKQHVYNVAAVLEWIVAFFYCFYVASFFLDFLPAIRTKHHQSSETQMQMAQEGGAQVMEDSAAENGQYFHGNRPAAAHTDGYTNGHPNGYTNGHTNGVTNGYTNGYPKPAEPAPLSSRNF
ncbi:Frag1/DRAM/Sfk1 family-domain-containing protein [Paraphoma chrysanthemicola]|uniref:Frag1/DRAM/Sfk1 family-domain-containing protein n=1 Tax=Paraphoma chrysanthemicola TaxID=798071 RepID=A0A8K0QZC6_9PLEO|nr:Frag1/DRAM/Sfk1 family-domain-containing protein [Paraphoma chrysanthemicola]